MIIMIIILYDNNHIIYIIMRASTCNDSNDNDHKDLYLGFGISYICGLPLLGHPRLYTSVFQDDLGVCFSQSPPPAPRVSPESSLLLGSHCSLHLRRICVYVCEDDLFSSSVLARQAPQSASTASPARTLLLWAPLQTPPAGHAPRVSSRQR